MKKFIMVTPLQPITRIKKDASGNMMIDPETDQPVEEPFDQLSLEHYTPIGNAKLEYDKNEGKTRFPIIPVINAYAEPGEEIQIFAVNTHTIASEVHFKQLEDEVAALAKGNGFICNGIMDVPVDYAGNVDTMVQMFRRLLDCFDDGDIIYACFTYGVKPMPIAELMAIQYAYRVKKNVSIGCLVYGDKDHSVTPAAFRIFDITRLMHLDENIRQLSEKGFSDPSPFIDGLIAFYRTEEESKKNV